MHLLVYCAGGLGKEVVSLAMAVNEIEKKWDKISFIDDVRKEKEYFGHEVFDYNTALLLKEKEPIQVVIANGEPVLRKKLWDKLSVDKFEMGNIIYPSPFSGLYADIGKGVVIAERCSISVDVMIEDNAFLQANCIIGHDTVIHKHSLISSHTCIAGGCDIGEQVYVGMSASIKEKTRVGRNSIVGIGATVFRNVKDNKIVVGNPAKVIGDNQGKVFGMF